MNLDRVIKIEVMSATVYYLVLGLCGILCAILLETTVVWNIFKYVGTSELGSSISITILVQIAVGICLLISVVLLRSYKHRKKFELFLCDLEDVNDFGFLKANYHIVNIDDHLVLFCRQVFSDCAEDWKLFQLNMNRLSKLFDNSKNMCDYS